MIEKSQALKEVTVCMRKKSRKDNKQRWKQEDCVYGELKGLA